MRRKNEYYDPTRSLLEELIKAAQGELKADLVVEDCNLVNVYTGEIEECVDIAIKGGRIVLVGEAESLKNARTIVVDGRGYYAAPGFLDAHLHFESSMLTLYEFARAILPHGTTGVFIDPHEIANVMGVKGVKAVAEEARNVPLRVFIGIPSCVPSSEIDSPHMKIDSPEVSALLEEIEATYGLGEVMDYVGVLACSDVLDKVVEALNRKYVVDGHAPLLSGKELCAYISAGITSCHESTSGEEALEKLRRGMYVMVREGSAWRDLEEIISFLIQKNVDTSRILLCTDDKHSLDIMVEGHMDTAVRRVVELGVDPVKAIQMATINTATRFHLDHILGGIAPGRFADILLIKRLETMEIEKTFFNGELVAERGCVLPRVDKWRKYRYPPEFYDTIRVPRRLVPEDFQIRAPIAEGYVKARIIGVHPTKTLTDKIIEEVAVKNHVVLPDLDKNIMIAAVVERHTYSGRIGLGLVKGLGIKRGAIASSIAHDSHNIIVVGASPGDMSKAVNTIVSIGGGLVVVEDAQVKAYLELPIAGLISDDHYENVAGKLKKIIEACRDLGSNIINPFMTLTLLALPVIPHLRLTDKGLFDVNEKRMVDVIVYS